MKGKSEKSGTHVTQFYISLGIFVTESNVSSCLSV
uniref:Uncharacterized protein n=1 Tax=Anguilla anguilla TaxID=7936 RepID=A0A0E9RTD6_ANGAN